MTPAQVAEASRILVHLRTRGGYRLLDSDGRYEVEIRTIFDQNDEPVITLDTLGLILDNLYRMENP